MDFFLKEALKEAVKAYKEGEVPVGAVIVKDGKIISRAHNKVEKKQSCICHAEILAIEKASKKLGFWRLNECEIYVTLEPCIMCLGAIINSRIKTIHIGARDFDKGAVTSKLKILEDNLIPCKTNAIIYDEKLCSYILTRFFRRLRNGKIKKQSEKTNKIL